MSEPFRIVAAGDACVLLQFESRIDEHVNAQAVAAAAALAMAALPGVRDIVPTFRSVAVHFDPLLTRLEVLLDALGAAGVNAGAGALAHQSEPVRIPVCYGGEFGPDLPHVAQVSGLSEEEVVTLHSKSAYRVFMLGFMPGFAYLGPVPRRIAAARRASPRTRESLPAQTRRHRPVLRR